MEDREPRAELVGEAEQVEVAAELAVVAALRLLDDVQVLLQRLLGLPGGAVDALELPVLLVATPVRRRGPHQLEGGDALGGGQVRAPAEVLPRKRPVALEVVVDGQLAGTDLDAGPLGGLGLVTLAALEPDQLDLVGLLGQLAQRIAVGDDPAREPLTLLDDLAHPGLDLLEVLGLERLGHVEVVVEAVGDGRPDAEPRVGVELLHRLRHHVRGRVAQDVAALTGVDLDGLDDVAVRDLVREVAQRAVDACCDHGRGVGEQLPGLGARRHGTLGALACLVNGDGDLGHRVSFSSAWAPGGGPADRIRRPGGGAAGFSVPRVLP